MLGHKHIGTEDLFVGLRREEKSFAAELLREAGVRLEEARKQLAASSGEPAPSLGVAVGGSHHVPTVEFVEDGQPLTAMMLVHPLLLRIGEELVLKSGDGDSRTYRVQNLRFVYTQRLEKIQVLARRVLSP